MHSRRTIEGGDLCAIFVHAGAGYHSTHNEKNHLKACSDAARVGMAILKNGGDAVEAVEMTIRLLEDREITNAGYGSNLTIDGQVECDACLVDHFGRSGAVGAISNVRNPILVAKLVLEASTQPLSLARVPPNLLVAKGAKDFALSHGVDHLPDDFLVSEGARARWQNWRRDLIKADAEARRNSNTVRQSAAYNSAPTTPVAGTNGSLSPPVTPQEDLPYHPVPQNVSMHPASDGPMLTYSQDVQAWIDDDSESGTDDNLATLAQTRKRPRTDGSREVECNNPSPVHVPLVTQAQQALQIPQEINEDMITDTVGAIAIDCFGRIAAGSSSGGIGMKHKGRCGPAALVGISTAVIPADPDDPDMASVATVTSGTGEHMATTAAAQTAADRISSCARKTHGRLEECTEDEALYSMIKNDFMNHPGVRNSPCQGAIGILSVKKTRHGIYFYFGHNTDSFAIASMHSDERKPVCVMSRSRESGLIAQGARRARARRAAKSRENV